MLHHTIPQTRQGALLAPLIAVIQRTTPWLRVDGILVPDHDHCYVLCFDEHHQIVVGFDTLSSWQTYRQIVGAATSLSEVVR